MKIELSKFLKKEKRFKKKDFVLDAFFYWKLVVLGVFLMIILFFFLGFYLFTKINREPDLSTLGEVKQIPTVDKNRMLEVITIFTEREKKSAEILNSPSPVVDPSL
ncbi:MAG: hypothetical protein WA060_00935 [Minisyncoccia bacterium]